VSAESKEEGKGDSVKEEDSHEIENENNEAENGGSGKKRKREEETADSVEGTAVDKTDGTGTEETDKEGDAIDGAVVSTGATEGEEDIKMRGETPASSLVTQDESSVMTLKTDDQKDENKIGQKEVDKLKFTAPKVLPVSTVRAVPQRHLYTERCVRALDVLHF
jgi:hypothetical protein